MREHREVVLEPGDELYDLVVTIIEWLCQLEDDDLCEAREAEFNEKILDMESDDPQTIMLYDLWDFRWDCDPDQALRRVSDWWAQARE